MKTRNRGCSVYAANASVGVGTGVVVVVVVADNDGNDAVEGGEVGDGDDKIVEA